MRSLIFGMVAVAAMTGSAFAQSSTYVRPNGFGGYTITQPSTGSITYVRPDGFGGYVAQTPADDTISYTHPDGLGGYRTQTFERPRPLPRLNLYGSDD